VGSNNSITPFTNHMVQVANLNLQKDRFEHA